LPRFVGELDIIQPIHMVGSLTVSAFSRF